MTSANDQQLVSACCNGDKIAYEALVDRHYRCVFAVCLGVLSSTHDAEDAAQEALLKGFERIGKLRAGDRFGAWITQIARNVCMDHLRRQERGRRFLKGHAESSSKSSRQQHDLEEAIQRLPAELRAPLVMFYLGGRNGKQIAEALNISHTGACKRLREARKELHRLLTDEGDAR